MIIYSLLPRFTICKYSIHSDSEVAQSCPTLWDPMDCCPPGSSIHGILQARILEWIACLFARGSSQSRDQTQVSCHLLRISSDSSPSEPPVNPYYSCRGGEKFFPSTLPGFHWDPHPHPLHHSNWLAVYKQKFNTRYTFCIHGRYPEKLSCSPKWSKPPQ